MKIMAMMLDNDNNDYYKADVYDNNANYDCDKDEDNEDSDEEDGVEDSQKEKNNNDVCTFGAAFHLCYMPGS